VAPVAPTIDLPTKLSAVEVTSGRASDYDKLLGGAA
jgi:hypothetical protein